MMIVFTPFFSARLMVSYSDDILLGKYGITDLFIATDFGFDFYAIFLCVQFQEGKYIPVRISSQYFGVEFFRAIQAQYSPAAANLENR